MLLAREQMGVYRLDHYDIEILKVKAMKQISVYIISVKGSRNCDNLIETLSTYLGLIPSILFGVTPSDLPCAGSTQHLHPGIPRLLSCTEVAAALSHSRAREQALKDDSEWSIFLEDDSELIQNVDPDFVSNVLNLPREIPFFVHLFPEQNGVLKRSRFFGMNAIWKVPDYANAYCLNKLALAEFVSMADINHLYLADWPRFSRRIHKLTPVNSIFRHPDQSLDSSLIRADRITIQANPFSYKPIYRLRQVIFEIIRFPFPKFGTEKIATENLRSVKLW
jgi:hypothetical protein